MLSPLKTEKIWLEKIDVRLSPAFDENTEATDYKLDLKADVRKRADAWAFRIRLGLTLTPEDGANCRYDRIAITTVGLFELPNDTPEEFVRQFVPLNCLAILHGFARGVVAQITGLNDGGPFLLPAVNLKEALQKKSRKSKSAIANTK